MTADIIDLSARLAAELESNSAPVLLDPRKVPLRFSTMKLIAQSPAHYLHAVRAGWEESLSMRIGTGAHAILFGQPFVVWTGKTRNGKVWDAFAEKHQGETILNQSERDKAQAIADSIRRSQLASRLLFADTQLETRIDWEWQGRSFRSTPDAASLTTCVDLKCLRSSEPDKIKWQSRNMFYHAQAALYRRALNSTGKHSISDNYLVVVENKPPHPVTVLRFTDSAIETGDRICAGWLEQVLSCEQNNDFPGYTQTIVDLELPMTDFVFDEDDEQEESDDGHTVSRQDSYGF